MNKNSNLNEALAGMLNASRKMILELCGDETTDVKFEAGVETTYDISTFEFDGKRKSLVNPITTQSIRIDLSECYEFADRDPAKFNCSMTLLLNEDIYPMEYFIGIPLSQEAIKYIIQTISTFRQKEISMTEGTETKFVFKPLNNIIFQ